MREFYRGKEHPACFYRHTLVSQINVWIALRKSSGDSAALPGSRLTRIPMQAISPIGTIFLLLGRRGWGRKN